MNRARVRRSQPAAVSVPRRRFDALVFDLDGVLTRTAAVHAAAWQRTFDVYLRRRAARDGGTVEPFTPEDYRRHVDGRPRYDGVNAFLASRGIALPFGSPADRPEAETICGIGNAKNLAFRKELAEHGVRVYEDTVALIGAAERLGFRLAVISASRNCRAVLQAAGLLDRFAVRVDGQEAERLGLAGKPAPDVFLEAARALGAAPARTVVFEDAVAGVAAGKRGGFGLVVGIDRGGAAAALREGGADVIVADLSDVTLDADAGSGRGIDELPAALPRQAEIFDRLGRRRPAVFLDYDGTLTPIVPDPDAAVMPEATRRSVRRLAELCPVAVISGRDLAKLRGFVQLDGVYYAGSHGFEIAGPEGRQIEHEQGLEFLPELDVAEAETRAELAGIPGTAVERKRFAFAVHYRHVAAADVPRVERVIESLLGRHGRLRRSLGKKVFEIQPKLDWDKGRAVRWLMRALGLEPSDVMPIYIGDDVTDEDGFRALAGIGLGMVVRGGEHPTVAEYCLADTDEVRRFLDLLIARLGSPAS